MSSRTVITTFRSSQACRLVAVDGAGERVGDLVDLIVDSSSGRISHGAIRVGAMLGMGGHEIAVPWERFHVDIEEGVAVINCEREELRNLAPLEGERPPSIMEALRPPGGIGDQGAMPV